MIILVLRRVSPCLYRRAIRGDGKARRRRHSGLCRGAATPPASWRAGDRGKDLRAAALDSSFLVAFHNTRDVHHEAASRIMPELISGKWGQAVLPEYVFLEVATVLLARRGREVAIKVTRILLQAREVEFVPCSELFLDTLETFRSQPGRKLNFTDAAIVTIARRREAAVVATFDRGIAEVEGIAVVPEVDTAPQPSESG